MRAQKIHLLSLGLKCFDQYFTKPFSVCVPFCLLAKLSLQPLFKALSKVWYSLEEEAEQLKILHNIMLNLQPFKASQAKLFTAELLDTLLKDSQVKTDEQRANETSGTGLGV